MAKYLVKARYKADGVRGVIKEGGSGRVAAVTKLAKGLGGKIEAFYFAYGEYDAYVIVDVDDEAAGLALEPGRERLGRGDDRDGAAHHRQADGRGDQEVGGLPGAGRLSTTPEAARGQRPCAAAATEASCRIVASS